MAMNYTWSAVAGVAIAIVFDLALLRTDLLRRKAFWVSYAIILGFQLVINGLLTGLPVVRYDHNAITGFRIAYAPFEDLLLGFALVLFTLSIWVRLDARAPRPVDRSVPLPPDGTCPPTRDRRTRRNRRARSR
jgi:lycopene cyclase domain-containing protein